MFSYQCSQLSTPESVIEVFHTAKRFQRNQDTSKYVSVVVLDEVGLAEDSPNLPLKALHPLLEDGTEGADDNQVCIYVCRGGVPHACIHTSSTHALWFVGMNFRSESQSLHYCQGCDAE